MRHDSLKSDIQTAQATTRTQRASASKLLHQGRTLRKQAESEPDPTKKASLLSEGDNCRLGSLHLRYTANSGRFDRRHMHLAAALLNGKTYFQCEAKCEAKPLAKVLAPLIQPHLPETEQAEAAFFAETWLKTGDTRLKALRDQKLAEAA